eukprot:sb/3465323/
MLYNVQPTDTFPQMLFCDGCDLATYHMACLHPAIEVIPEEDWYCPICEQLLLYLHLQQKFRKLNLHLMARGTPSATKVRKKPKLQHSTVHSAPRYGNILVTTNQKSLFRSRDWLSANRGPVFPGMAIFPCNGLVPVYEHNIDDDNVRGRGKRVSSGEEDEVEDAILMRPEDVVSSESDDEDEFSYRPRAGVVSTNGYYSNNNGTSPNNSYHGYTSGTSRRYTGDDFLAEAPTRVTDNTPPSRMGYNPLGSLYGSSRPRPTNNKSSRPVQGSNMGYNSTTNRSSRPTPSPSSRPSSTPSSHQNTATAIMNSSRSRTKRELEPHARPTTKRPMMGQQNGVVKPAEPPPRRTVLPVNGAMLSAKDHTDQISRENSGNVTMDTKKLSEAQLKALAAWEEEERERLR